MLALPIRKTMGSPASGYDLDPDREGWMVPDMTFFTYLCQGKRYLEAGESYQRVAGWIQQHSGKYVSPSTLMKIMRDYPPIADIILNYSEEDREKFCKDSYELYFLDDKNDKRFILNRTKK